MAGTTKLMTPGGGGVNLTPASSIASDVTVSLPSITGTTLVSQSSGVTSGFSSTNTFLGNGAGSSVTSGTNNTILGAYNGNQNSLDIRTASNYIVLSDGVGNPRCVIDNNGNLVVGGVAAGGGQDTNAVSIGPQGFGNLTVNHATGTASGSTYANFCYAGPIIGSISQNGTTGVLYNTSSDYRLKENVTPIANGLDAIKALNPVTFDWISDGSEDSGFIAHEFQSVIPRSVTSEKDAVDEEGNPVYQAMDSKGAIPFLVAAIKELSAKNDALEARISALEAK